MSIRRTNTFISIVVLLALLIQPLASVAAAPQPQAARPPAADPADPGFLFRASVKLAGSRNLARLEKLGVVVLASGQGSVDSGQSSITVLADADQLEALARLGFQPRAADELRLLVSAQGPEKAWLANSLQPLLAQADVMVARQALAGVASATAPDRVDLQTLRTSMRALTPQQTAGIAGLTSVDDDDDGLTNTQEAWWCTDPLDDDTDDDGTKDGVEIQVLKDWMANKRAGPPGETPWPNWPMSPTSLTCPDKDSDAIPNLAERWELGLNMDLESSDRDRYDDGQELFGTTYCPGSGNACGYGQLPSANHDGILLFPQMPSWVTVPANHPLVAAYPQVEVDIVPGEGGKTFKMVAATVVTTDKRVEEGEAKSYSTTKTEGTSTSNAETETWEEWQEVSTTTEASVQAARTDLNPTFARPAGDVIKINNKSTQVVQTTNVSTTSLVKNVFNVAKTANPAGGYAIEKATQAADFVLSEACAEVQCKQYAGAAVRATVRTAKQSFDAVQDAIKSNKCGTGIVNQVKCAAQAVGTTFVNNWSKTFDARLQEATLAEQEARGQVGGATMASDGTSLDVRTVYPITYPAPAFVPTETHTSGSSKGGAHTTTHTQYEEHAITEGTTKQFGTSWGTATAENSAHAADLWFAYEIRNVGADYARVICNLAFNVYIGSDPTPAATYYPGADLGGDGCFTNFRPGEAHKYTFPSAKRINLTLEQMKTVDLGGPVRIVVEDFSLGQDDFYTDDAVKGGVTVSIEDGPEDGDDLVNSYVMPTWGEDTILDVLARYFPHETDATGLMTAIWTPEYRADAPSWCLAPQRVGTTLWCKHAMSTADWWSIYLNGLGDGSEGFQDTSAAPDTVALFRFNSDNDGDGYSDRTELRLGTDPNDPKSIAKPELLAGLYSAPDGNNVVATLSLLNTGVYDAYGVEAVMIAPDDTTSITNNTVGGSGRVRAQRQIIVGSRIAAQSPLPAAWLAQGHAQPVAGGYYTGDADRTYTFTVAGCGDSLGCAINSVWTLNWSDGQSASGSLAFNNTYKSPTLRGVGAFGLELGFRTGKVFNGDSFTVAATTPRDTFQYTIAAGHETDYTPPVVVVSYNDPQGNHRFVTPINLTLPTDNLIAHTGKMLHGGAGVEIVTSAPFTATQANTTDLVVQAPPGARMLGAHVFLEFIDPNGTVVREEAVTSDLEPGPNLVAMAWNPADFNPAYDPAQDYIVMAFFTDWQGNIVGTAGRPLSSFQADPKPALAFVAADTTWDFGTVAQGTVLNHTFTLANTGLMNLKATVVGTGTRTDQTVPGQLAWTDTGLEVTTGDALGIRASGQVCYGGNGTTLCYGPDGNGTVAPADWTAPSAAAHGLVAKIGSGTPFFVGATYIDTAAADGRLYLGSNDRVGTYGDNGGSYQAHIEIQGLPTSFGSRPSLSIEPSGATGLNVMLDTYYLPVGVFERSVTVRTSDPAHRTQTFRAQGTVQPYGAPARSLAISPYRPWDVKVAVSGDRTYRELVTFNDTIAADAAAVQPLWVYDDTRQNRLGAGKLVTHATASGITASAAAEASTSENTTIAVTQHESSSTSPAALPNAVAGMEEMFGDGRDGVMPSSGNLDNNNGAGTGIAWGSQGSYYINVTDTYAVWRIQPGDVVLIHQTQGSGAGCWELNKAVSDFGGGTATWQLAKPLQCNYSNGGNNHAQVQRVPQYTDCPVSGTVTPLYAWNGSTGGIFAVMCNGTLNVQGTIYSDGGNGATGTEGNPSGGSGAGFRGGKADAINNDNYGGGDAGEGYIGPGSWEGDGTPNGNGGGAGDGLPSRGNYGTGGGGGNGSAGTASTSGGIGYGGVAYGNAELSSMVFGGGGGGSNDNPGNSVG